MIDIQTVQRILRLHAEGHSLRFIANTLGVSVNSVRHYIQHPDFSIRDKPVSRNHKLGIFSKDELVSLYRKARGNCVVVTQELHHQARSRGIEDFSVDPTTVRRYLRNIPEVHRPAEPIHLFEVEPGQQLQIDFVEAHFQFEGCAAPSRVYIYEAVYAWSHKAFVRVCPDMRQESWLMSTALCMAKHGIPKQILVDNDKSLVARRVNNKPAFSPAFYWLCRPLGLKPIACQIRKPRTKGRVERFGRYLQENALAQAEVFGEIRTPAQLNDFLQDWIRLHADERLFTENGISATVRERYAIEARFLLFPEKMDEIFAIDCRTTIVRPSGHLHLYGQCVDLGYAYRNQQVYVSLRADGSYLITDTAGRPVMEGNLPPGVMHNHHWNDAPISKASITSEPQPKRDRRLEELSHIMEKL